jgi:integrase
VAASTVDRVRATLRSALNAAVREGLIASNPLAQVRLDKPVRPHPVIWTDERVEAWRRDGVRPPVAVWTLRQLVTFLTGVEKDRLAALWWLIALCGLRRGEAAALDRDDLDSESRELTITRQLIALPGDHRAAGGTVLRAAEEPRQHPDHRPGRGGTRRLVDQALRQTVELLRHQFTDLRHGTATLALASRTDLKVIQQMLGHSSIVTTADTYTSVLPETAHRAAQATADMVIKAARNVPGAKRGGTTVTHIPAAVTASGYCQT